MTAITTTAAGGSIPPARFGSACFGAEWVLVRLRTAGTRKSLTFRHRLGRFVTPTPQRV